MVNLVSFPGLGMEFLLNRVVIEILGRPIYWYGLIIACGFLAGATVASKYAPKFGVEEDHIYDYLFYAVPAALVGLRVYFVLFYLDLFKNPDGSLDWPAIFRISDGGMAIYGGIIAGILVMYYYCRSKKISFYLLSDIGALGLILGQGIGRWGNFTNVEAYGGLTSGSLRMCSESIAKEMLAKGYATVEEYQAILDGTLGVHPTFFYESLWNFLGFAILLRLAKGARKFEGELFLTYFTWYGLGRFFIEGMRTDSLYFFGLEFFGYPLRTSQMLSLFLCLTAGHFLRKGKKGACTFLVPVNFQALEADKKVEEKTESLSEDCSVENLDQEQKTELVVSEELVSAGSEENVEKTTTGEEPNIQEMTKKEKRKKSKKKAEKER